MDAVYNHRRDSAVSDTLLKPRSGALTDGASRAGARAMLRACGLQDDDFKKPLIGVANTWIEIGPCNYHLRELAQHVKEGIRAAGGTPLEFNTVSISDGIAMGTEGMRASLVSREVITDSIELVTRGNLFDALMVLVGCDKTIPGGIMALARLNIPGLILYGGSIAPGQFEGHSVTIQDVYEAIGRHSHGGMTDAQLKSLEVAACPGAGARCDFQGFELSVSHSAVRVPADGLVHILNGHGVTLELAGSNRAAIENESGNIQARQGHDAAGNGLVTADENHQGIEEI